MLPDERRGFTLIELLIVVAIIGVLAAVAVPNLLRARLAANEASAIESLRSVNSAQATFSKSCGHGTYATDLGVLAVGENGTGIGFISADLATNGIVKSGYRLALSDGGAAAASGVTACNGKTQIAWGYAGNADPRSPSTGRRHFGINTIGTIWQGSAPLSMTSSSAPAGGSPIQ